MIHDIESMIDVNVCKFLEDISKEYRIDYQELEKKWKSFFVNKTVVMSIPETTKKKRSSGNKKSKYQNFFVEKRKELKERHPELNFGDLSSMISKLWSSMTKEEQERYAQTEEMVFTAAMSVTKQRQLDSSHTTTTHGCPYTFQELNQKKMSELRELCEKQGIKRTGNKNELIKHLLGDKKIDNANHAVASSSSITTKVMSDPYPEALQVVISKNVKRADIEEEETHFSEEEQDFDFEDENENSVEDEDDESAVDFEMEEDC